uniref:F-box domain-containing protein n=1 Tax=Rhizophagus irregularis (strain DAOM 181602 / DAOM 197198 / MUCL 43194) TaxID=747089 RepID=U9TXD0_RHIID
MACSKVFSGDLPELTDEIMQYLRKDLSTLYSCIFVNRLWCRLAIPLLWEDPFLIPNQHYRCIGAYLSFLNEDSKAKFNEYGIDDKLLLSNTLFNYPSFIKYFDTYRVCRSASKWVVTLIDECNEKLEILVYSCTTYGYGS